MFGKSLSLNAYSKILKLSSLTPMFKSGEFSDFGNYRPITILSNPGEMFKFFVLRYTLQPVVNQVLVEEQHRFHPNRSVITCNLVFVSYI